MNLTKSKIFLFFCLSFIIGTAFASFLKIPYFIIGIFLIVAIVLVILFWQTSHQSKLGAGQGKKEMVVLGFCLMIAVLGVWRYQSATKVSVGDISQFNGKGKIVFAGIIDKEPDRRMENQKIIIKIVKVVGIDRIIGGRVLITVNKYPEYSYGDEIKISCKLQEPKNFEGFDYQQYLAKDDIYSVAYNPQAEITGRDKGNKIKASLFKLKDKFEGNLGKILPEPQASYADGLVLGEKSTLPQNILNNFSTVGITHIIALSGFNITIIAESLRRFFNSIMVSRNSSFWITVIFIIGFVVMTGASASIVRAAVMGILLILARKSGRLYSIRNALVFAGLIMIFLNPKILRFDLGFQLSFLAALGLIYISPLFEKYFLWLPKRFDIQGIASATLGAQLAVFPLLLFSFGKLSLISPVANLLILPFVPLAMFWIFLSGFLSFIWLVPTRIIAWISWLILTYQIKIAELLAKIPYAAINVNIGWVWLVVMYAALWGVIILNSKIKMQKAKLFGYAEEFYAKGV
jgi:competence protein ComEC